MRCKLCLAAAATAALVLAGAVLIGWLLPLALAEAPVELRACSVKTCTGVSEETQKALGHGESVYILPSEVVGVSAIYGCDACAKVMTRQGKSLFVLATPANMTCLLFGGERCAAKGAAK